MALSSTEAELVALCSSVKDSLGFKKLLIDMDLKVQNVKVFEDNQGCIALVKKTENNKRVRHIDVKYDYIGDGLKENKIVIEYINTKEQLADRLTKGLSRIRFNENFDDIGLQVREG